MAATWSSPPAPTPRIHRSPSRLDERCTGGVPWGCPLAHGRPRPEDVVESAATRADACVQGDCDGHGDLNRPCWRRDARPSYRRIPPRIDPPGALAQSDVAA